MIPTRSARARGRGLQQLGRLTRRAALALALLLKGSTHARAASHAWVRMEADNTDDPDLPVRLVTTDSR